MQSFKNKAGAVVVSRLIQTIQMKKDYLSEVDGLIGDGDHGINMNKGFTLCEKKLQGMEYDLAEGLSVLSITLMEDIGGSMGPLYGMLFDEMSLSCENVEDIDANVFAEMIANAVEGVMSIGNAKLGDKSMLDTLIPAKEAFLEAHREGKDFYESLNQMADAAEKGWRSTEDMVAKIGRASRLGERSKGVLDAGATSCYIIIKTIACSMQELLRKETYES